MKPSASEKPPESFGGALRKITGTRWIEKNITRLLHGSKCVCLCVHLENERKKSRGDQGPVRRHCAERFYATFSPGYILGSSDVDEEDDGRFSLDVPSSQPGHGYRSGLVAAETELTVQGREIPID